MGNVHNDRRSLASRDIFYARLDELGAELLEEEWLGATKPHRVRCAAGHECFPRPRSLRAGNGPCLTCGHRQRGEASRSGEVEHRFRQRLDELGAMLLEPTFLGTHKPHQVRCAAGHECFPRPHGVLRGQGICRACAGMDSVAAETSFNARLAELGATRLEPRWLGSGKPHHVRCINGHDCHPRPNNVRSGGGVCPACFGMLWDVFYVVIGLDRTVKFGISSGDARVRLRAHKRAGYTEVVRLCTGLPKGLALDTERSVKDALRIAGIAPTQGREYFPPEALAVVLDIVDGWLACDLATSPRFM